MFGELNDKAYEVGGCIRDELLGRKPSDIDYVIEATEEEFARVFPNAERVGENFPVYLIGGHEVALTRTEKCIGERYTDFEVTGVGVPIRDDLIRRDFTINSIAKHVVTGTIVDPTGGCQDLREGVVRCTNPVAFNEDPLRIYRGARFANRLGFRLEPATKDMMREHVEKLRNIKPERVLLELEKVYEQSKPSDFFRRLNDIRCLHIHFAPLHKLLEVPAGPAQYHSAPNAFEHTMDVIDRCWEAKYSFDCFLACLCHDFGKGTTNPEILPHHYGHEMRSYMIAKDWMQEHRFTARQQKLIETVARHHMNMHFLARMKDIKAVRFYRQINRDLKVDFLKCCNCDHELSSEVNSRWLEISDAVTNATIEVPVNCKDVQHFVENKIVDKMKEMRNERRKREHDLL